MVEITDELRRGIDPNDIAGAEKLMNDAADMINMLRATWAEAEAELSARPASAGVGEIERLTAERDVLTQDARWAINVLLETIAKKFDDWSTWDIWKSEAAGTVRSFKHDLSPARAGSKPEGDR